MIQLELLEPEAKHAMENAHTERDNRIAKLKARQVLALKKRMFKSNTAKSAKVNGIY